MSKPFKVYATKHVHGETPWALEGSSAPEAQDALQISTELPPRKSHKKMVLVLAVLLALFASATGVAGLVRYLRVKHQAKIELIRQWRTWNQQTSCISDNAATIRKLADKATASGKKAQGLLDSANATVAVVVGRPSQPASPAVPIEVAARTLREHVARISRDTGELAALAKTSTVRENEARRTPYTTSLAAQANESGADLTAAQQIAQTVQTELAQTKEAMKQVQMHKEAFDRQKKEERRLADERKKQEEAKKREEATEALVKDETARVKERQATAKILLSAFKCEEALQTLTLGLSELKTDQGKELMGKIIDRYARLRNLKLFLIKRLNSDPFAWGWGWGASARDVLGADDSGVKLKDRVVPWAEVNASQMKQFIDHYLMSGKITTGQASRFKLAAALYFQELGFHGTAVSYAKEVSQDYEWMLDDLSRLLSPELAAELDLSEK